MEGSSHALTLKVMRISRPTIASAWEPFFSSSSAFSAHSTASILSLQEDEPLPGHPKTLRDLTHASEVLTLPAAFGAIQLGETFSSCLCVNNEAPADVVGLSVKVEIQTASSKVLLTEIGGPTYVIKSGDTLEIVISHEIKELGQHVLACTVAYNPPTGFRPPSSSSAVVDGSTGTLQQVFRKFYKFQVSNPLSVRTKVHVPRSPVTSLSRTEREKLFLEVHLQNLTQEPLWFERMRFEPLEEWEVNDINVTESGDSIFSGTMAILQPHDTRQYIYILTPVHENPDQPSFHVPPAPGSVIPLGRLDISWRSSMGEPGRLLTSVLSRRIPAAPPRVSSPAPQPASAIPSYLQRSSTMGQPPSRPRSPLQGIASPAPQGAGVAPHRRTGTPVGGRSQSPAPSMSTTIAPSFASRPDGRPDIDVDLVLTNIDREAIYVHRPFSIGFNIVASVALAPDVPVPGDTHARVTAKVRVIKLAVQHISLSPPKPQPVHQPHERRTLASLQNILSPLSGISTPSPNSTPVRSDFNFSLAEQKLRHIVESPEGIQRTRHNNDDMEDIDLGLDVKLPPPTGTASTSDPEYLHANGGLKYLGSSIQFLPAAVVTAETKALNGKEGVRRGEISQDFALTWMPFSAGFARVGGLRVLLVGDRTIPYDPSVPLEADELLKRARSDLDYMTEARTLNEWGVVTEVWVYREEEIKREG